MRHWLWLIVVTVVLAAIAAYLVSSTLPKTYEGRTKWSGPAGPRAQPEGSKQVRRRIRRKPISAVAHETEEPNLRIITTAPLPPNPAELLGSHRMRELQRLGAEADLIVVDSPPLHAVTDAAVLAAELDGTLLVVHAGRTPRGAARQAKEALDRVGERVLGVVLNRLTERSSAGYDYRYYGDYYGTPSSSSEVPVSASSSRVRTGS